MIEGSGPGSIPLTNGSGSMRHKNMWIRIRNTAFGWLARPSGSRSSSLSSRPLNTLPYSPLLSVKLRKLLVSYEMGGYRTVLRIRDVYPGSNFFSFRIRTVAIPDPGYASKNLSILTPKKRFLSSRKYDPGCSSQIQMLTFYPSRIPDPGVKKAPRIPDPQHWYRLIKISKSNWPDRNFFCWVSMKTRLQVT